MRLSRKSCGGTACNDASMVPAAIDRGHSCRDSPRHDTRPQAGGRLMDRQIHDTARHAWQRAELAEARQRAVALAGDVVAYHAALVAAGIDGELVVTLVTQFNRAWL